MKLTVTLTGNSQSITARDGREFTLTEVYVHDASRPYPLLINHFGTIPLAAGDYIVPIALNERNKRLELDFNFKNAVSVPRPEK